MKGEIVVKKGGFYHGTFTSSHVKIKKSNFSRFWALVNYYHLQCYQGQMSKLLSPTGLSSPTVKTIIAYWAIKPNCQNYYRLQRYQVQLSKLLSPSGLVQLLSPTGLSSPTVKTLIAYRAIKPNCQIS